MTSLHYSWSKENHLKIEKFIEVVLEGKTSKICQKHKNYKKSVYTINLPKYSDFTVNVNAVIDKETETKWFLTLTMVVLNKYLLN